MHYICVSIINYKKTNMKTVELKVINVVCGVCASRLDRMLEQTDGVENATINIKSKSLNMDYNPNVITLEEVKEKFIAMGYDVEI